MLDINMFKKIDERSKLYVIEGNPIALARARHGRRKTWDSQKQQKLIAGINLKNQHGSLPLWDEPLCLKVMFYMPVPKAKQSVLWGRPHRSRPDLSNLIKFIEDVSTGIVYRDDALISSCWAHKVYDECPRTEFFVEPWRSVWQQQ